MRVSLTGMISLMVVGLLAGCAHQADKGNLANGEPPALTYIGAHPPRNYKNLIKKNFGRVLAKPEEATYRFMRPSLAQWSVVCGVVTTKAVTEDSKEIPYPFIVLFKNGKIVGRIFRESGPSEIAAGEFNDPC